jgi:hypothetical protein
MVPFSATEAGLEGFRITRENPRAFALWAIFSFAISVLGAIVTVSMPAEVRSALQTLSSEQTPTAQELGDALIATAPLLLFGLTVQCVMAAAVYRIIFRHDDARFGYLRLGMDELRLMAFTILFLLLVIGLLVGVTLGAGLVMAVVSAISASAAMVAGGVVELFAIGLVAYVLVRLSLGPVITFAERRITMFESWRVTRHQFWPLFLAYALAVFGIFLIMIVTMVLFIAVSMIVIKLTGGQVSDITALFNPDETSYSAYFNPGMLAYMVVGSVMTALWYAVIAAPGAWAYLKLHGEPPAHA